MKNNKGFTLIELIFVIVILGIIIAFSLPNITSSIERNKKDSFLNDAIDMIEKAKALTANNPAFLPSNTEISIFSLNFIDKKEEIKESEYGLSYNRSYSFVTVNNKNNEYEYKVSLLACNNTSSNIIKAISEEISLLDNGKPISIVAARKGDNYIYYDKNKDGYINSDDVTVSDTTIGVNDNFNIANQICNNDNDYYRIKFASINDLNDENKYSKVEELYELDNIDNKDSYFDAIINSDIISTTKKLKFYY